MRLRTWAAVVVGLVGLAALGMSLAAVETGTTPSGPGTIQGQVLGEGPVSGWQKLTNITLDIRSHSVIVAKDHVPDGDFKLHLRPGTYALSIYGPPGPAAHLRHRTCWTNVEHHTNTVVVAAAKRSTVTLRCPLPSSAALG